MKGYEGADGKKEAVKLISNKCAILFKVISIGVIVKNGGSEYVMNLIGFNLEYRRT